MAIKYLIDVNLPRFFSVWNNRNFIHQYDLGDEWADIEIWNYAKENNLTIITKDADFSAKMILQTPPPKVVHIRLGNMKMKQFHDVISSLWSQIIELNKDYKLINVFSDRLEGIK